MVRARYIVFGVFAFIQVLAHARKVTVRTNSFASLDATLAADEGNASGYHRLSKNELISGFVLRDTTEVGRPQIPERIITTTTRGAQQPGQSMEIRNPELRDSFAVKGSSVYVIAHAANEYSLLQQTNNITQEGDKPSLLGRRGQKLAWLDNMQAKVGDEQRKLNVENGNLQRWKGALNGQWQNFNTQNANLNERRQQVKREKKKLERQQQEQQQPFTPMQQQLEQQSQMLEAEQQQLNNVQMQLNEEQKKFGKAQRQFNQKQANLDEENEKLEAFLTMEQQPALQLRTGDKFHVPVDWKINEENPLEFEQKGEGFFGVVGVGYSGEWDADVAIKVSTEIEVAKNEIQIMNALRNRMPMRKASFHPYIVGIYAENHEVDKLYKKDRVFIMMERATLVFDQLITDQSYSLLQKLLLFTGALKGLEYMHTSKYVHHDLKPENIAVVDYSGKLFDFGMSTKFDYTHNKSNSFMKQFHNFTRGWLATKLDPKQLARLQVGKGTGGYIAPEWRVQAFGPEADIFAMGVILYEIVVGERVPRVPAPESRHSKDTPLEPNYAAMEQKLFQQDMILQRHSIEFRGIIWRACNENKDVRWTVAEFIAQMKIIIFYLSQCPDAVVLRGQEEEFQEYLKANTDLKFVALLNANSL